MVVVCETIDALERSHKIHREYCECGQLVHLSGFKVDSMQHTIVVLDLDGPGLVVIEVLMCDMHNGRDHVCVHL